MFSHRKSHSELSRMLYGKVIDKYKYILTCRYGFIEYGLLICIYLILLEFLVCHDCRYGLGTLVYMLMMCECHSLHVFTILSGPEWSRMVTPEWSRMSLALAKSAL